MKNLRLNTLSFSIGLALATSTPLLFAQSNPVNQPDSGSLRGSIGVAPQLSLPKQPIVDVTQEQRAPLALPGGAKVKVVSFRITGNTVFTEEQLLPFLSGFVGKELDFAGLDEAAATVSTYYRRRGYFVARAYLPTQSVSSGALEIAVIEGRLGDIQLKRDPSVRLSDDRLRLVMAGSAPLGEPIKDSNLERGLMLLNDMPGIEVKSTLVPGARVGTSDLVVETMQGPKNTGGIDVDNYGNKFSGPVRLGGTYNLNDPAGRGDQLVLRGLTTSMGSGSDAGGMRYFRGAYSLPINSQGTRLGVAYTGLNYTLGDDFKALNANGTTSVATAYLIHPFVRSRNTNFYTTVSYDVTSDIDNSNGANVSDKRKGTASLGLSGDSRDGWGGGGMTAGSLTLTSGNMTQNNVATQAYDNQYSQMQGGFTKVLYNFSRLQALSDNWSFYAALTGQAASKNLDTAERFVLGGTGVRAYPVGEAAGDEGMLVNLEARYNVPGTSTQLVGFIDAGSITLHKNPWTGWQPTALPNFPNNYSLAGYGLGLNVFKAGDFFIKASVAWKLGTNPGVDALGRDSDNTTNSTRFWLQAAKQF